jgi:Flp pilus assembly pilin Flp
MIQARITAWALTLSERLRRDEGQGFAEYALVLAFVVVVATAILASTGLQTAIQSAFTKVSTAISGA